MDLNKENKFHSYDMNDTKLLGRLTGDAKPNEAGNSAIFYLAVNENYRTSESINEVTGEVERPSEIKERVSFIQICCYQPNLFKYLTKGRKILVDGKLRTYKDKSENTVTYVAAAHVYLLDWKDIVEDKVAEVVSAKKSKR